MGRLRHAHTSSRTQTLTSLSTAEAELYAITSGVKEGLFLCGLLEESGLTIEGQVHIRTDAKAALDLLHRTGGVGKFRHVNIRYFFVRNLMKESTVKFSKVSAHEHPSDILTHKCAESSFGQRDAHSSSRHWPQKDGRSHPCHCEAPSAMVG